MALKRLVPVFVVGLGLADASAVELTKDNFESLALNGGKSAFVKFLAPW